MNTWVLERLRSSASHAAAAWALVATALVAGLFTQAAYYRNCFAGPYAVDETALSAVTDPAAAANRYVRATGTKTVHTGLQEVTVTSTGGVETGSKPTAEYVAMRIGKRYLLCRTAKASETTQTGELKAITEELAGQFFNTPEMKAHRDLFYPFYLDDDDFRTAAYWELAGAALLGFLAYFFGLRNWRVAQDPSSDPVAKRLQAAGDPVGLSAHAEQELKAPLFKAAPGWAITDRFVIKSTFFNFDVQRVEDVVWAYKKVIQRRVYFVPAGKSYQVEINFADGSASLQGSEPEVDRMLGALAERAPWALFGFAKDRETLFTGHRADFVAEILRRRAEFAAKKTA